MKITTLILIGCAITITLLSGCMPDNTIMLEAAYMTGVADGMQVNKDIQSGVYTNQQQALIAVFQMKTNFLNRAKMAGGL